MIDLAAISSTSCNLVKTSSLTWEIVKNEKMPLGNKSYLSLFLIRLWSHWGITLKGLIEQINNAHLIVVHSWQTAKLQVCKQTNMDNQWGDTNKHTPPKSFHQAKLFTRYFSDWAYNRCHTVRLNTLQM